MARHPQSGKKTLRVTEVLSDRGSSLGSLLKHASTLARLEQLLAGCLDPCSATRFQVSTVRENRLILISPSASQATRLRMQTPELIRSLHEAGYPQIKFIDIRIAPLVRQSVDQRKTKSLSPAAKQAFDLMNQLQADEDETQAQTQRSDHTDGG